MKITRALLICVAWVLAATTAAASAQTTQPVYLDPTQPTEARVQNLISQMTLEEKTLELYHNAPGIERLHVPMWGGWNQCLHGVWSKRPTTEFPVSIALAATWDPALAKEETTAISDEGRALYNIHADGPNGKHGLVYRAPVINISRNPLWGRVQECFGEDPTLTGRMGVAYVQGLQGDDPKYLKLASTLKHFAVNNVETNRVSLEAQVPERMLYEYWLPHFRDCVVEGHARSLMAAYNGINGYPCAVNRMLLTDILRDQWKFDGFVVSDLGGIKHLIDGHHLTTKPEEAAAKALRAGCDMDDEAYRDALPKAVRAGLVTEEDVNKALARVLRVGFNLGAFDPPGMVPYSNISADVIDSAKHRALAKKVEEEAIVLLKNEGGLLPLDAASLKSVAVIGPCAEKPEYGNYFGVAPRRVGPLEGLKNKLGAGVKVTGTAGCEVVGKADPDRIAEAVDAAKAADVAILFLGTNGKVEAEGRDRKTLGLPEGQEQLLEAVTQANPKTIAVFLNAGPLSVAWAKEHTPAMLEVWYPGEEGGDAIADTLLGDNNPSGRLPYTVYESTDQIPPPDEYDITKGYTYMYFTGKPVYPFGHGLSYTTFEYSNLRDVDPPFKGDWVMKVDVRNTGRRAGSEVVQIFMHEIAPVVKDIKFPNLKLAGFSRVSLAPGEKKTVGVRILGHSGYPMAYYDVRRHAFAVSSGPFDVLVGRSAADIQLRGKCSIILQMPVETLSE